MVKKAARPAICKGRQTEPVFILLCGPLVPAVFALATRCRGTAGEARPGGPPSGAGFSATAQNWTSGSAVTSNPRTNPGASMRPTSKCRDGGATCIERSISAVPRSTSCCRYSAMGSGQATVPQSVERSIASPAPCHQHRRGSHLQVGDSCIERGRDQGAGGQKRSRHPFPVLTIHHEAWLQTNTTSQAFSDLYRQSRRLGSCLSSFEHPTPNGQKRPALFQVLANL